MICYDSRMNIREEITKYVPVNEQEEKDQKELIRWIDTGLDLWTRDNGMAHWTASAWVIDPTRTKALMAWHNIYHSWSWLGGHADGDHDLLHVAMKEVKEESGVRHLKPLSNDIFSIEILTVDGHIHHGSYVSSHLHLNVTYLLEADPDDPVFVKKDENSAVGWFLLDEAVAKSDEPWFRDHIYSKLNTKLRRFVRENRI